MIVRMARWECAEPFWDEDRKRFESTAIPILQEQDGFIEARLLAVPGSTRRIAFTVWRDWVAYEAFVRSPVLERITAAFQPMYVDGELPEAERFEVLAQGSRV